MRAALIFGRYFSIWVFKALLLAAVVISLSYATGRAQTSVSFLDSGGELRPSGPPTPPPAKSKLAFRVQIPRGPVIEALNRFDTYREIGKVTDCPTVLSLKVCNYSYDISFSRDGAAELDFNKQTIVARVPIQLTGDIAYRTKASEAATLNKLNGRFKLVLETKLSIEQRWCVDVDTKISVEWRDRPKLADSAVLNTIIDGMRPLDAEVEQNVASILSKERMAAITGALCQTIREQVSKFWRPHIIEFSAKNLGLMYAHIVPRSIKYSGPTFSDTEMILGVHLDAETSVAFRRRVIDIGELPPLEPTDSIREQILLDVPAFMSLPEIKSTVMQIVASNKFDIPFPIGGLEAKLHNVEPYLLGDGRLEFKADYSVGFKWLPLRAWGEATVTGKPDVAGDRRIAYNQVEAKIQLTSSLLGTLFGWAIPRAEQALRVKLADVVKYDVKKEIDLSTEELKRQVAGLDTLTGFQLELKDFNPVLERLWAVENSGLALYARASGRFEARLREFSPAIFQWLKEYEGPFKRPYEIVNIKRERPYLRQANDAKFRPGPGKEIDWDAGSLRLTECKWFSSDIRYMWCHASMLGPEGERKTGWIRQYFLAPKT